MDRAGRRGKVRRPGARAAGQSPVMLKRDVNPADPRAWTPELVAAIEQQLRTRTPADRLAEKRLWRDAQMASLDAMKRAGG